MAQYIGTQQDLLARYRSDAQQQAQKMMNDYNKNLEKMIEEHNKKSFGDWLSLAPSAFYSLMKGALDGATSFVNGLNVLATTSINDMRRVFDGEDGTNAAQDFKYAAVNFYTSLAEGLGTAGISLIANFGRLNSSDTTWAFGEGGAIEKLAQGANRLRADALGIDPSNIEDTKEAVDARFYDEQRQWIKDSVATQRWVSKNITSPIANSLTLSAKQRTDDAFNDSELYNVAMGSMESIGNILVSWGIAKVAAGIGASSALVKTASTTYFASSIFGRSYQDAIDNGADMQDAYVYAMGNAFIETALENIGGFKTTGAGGLSKTSLFEKVLGQKYGSIISSMISEGFEELAAEYTTTGLEYYGNSENKIEQIGNAEFHARVGYAFLGGAISSLGLGASRNMYFKQTLEGKAEKLVDVFNKEVKEGGEEKAIKKVKSRLITVVDALNNEDAKGIITNERGADYTGTLTLEQKKKYIKDSGLSQFITEKNGKFEINEKTVGKFSADMFKNKIAENGELKVVDDKTYAHSKAVRGYELTDNGARKIVERSKLTVKGEIIQSAIEDLDTAVVITDDDNADAVYGSNGVIYISQKADFNSKAEVIDKIVRHEFAHKLKDESPELFTEIQNEIDSLIDIAIDDKGNFSIVGKNGENNLTKLLRSKGYDKQLQTAAADYMTQTNNNVEKSVDLLKEEVVAYFVENIINDGNFASILSSKKTGLLTQLFDKLDQNIKLDKVAEGDKKVYRALKKIRNKFEQVARETVKAQNTMRDFTKRLFGNGYDWSRFIKSDILEKYGENQVLVDFFTTIDFDKGTVTISGVEMKVEDVVDVDTFNLDIKRMAKPERDDIAKEYELTWQFDPNQIKEYIKHVKSFLRKRGKDEILNHISEKNEMGKQAKELKYILSVADYLLEDLLDTGSINDNDKYTSKEEKERILKEIEIENRFEELSKTWKKRATAYVQDDEIRATYNVIQRYIKFMKDHTAYIDWSNRTYSQEFDSAAYHSEFYSGEDTEAQFEAALKTLQAIIYFNFNGEIEVRGIYYPDFKDGQAGAEFFAEPTEEAIEKTVEKMVKNRTERELKRELELQETHDGLTYQQRFDMQKFYTDKEIAKTFVEDIKKEVKSLYDIDIEQLNVIEPSAGSGVFLDVFKEMGINNVQAYDISPENDAVNEANFLETNIEYDEHNIVIGNPPFTDGQSLAFLEHAFTMAPVVAFILPATWQKSYQTHKEISQGKHLVFTKHLGKQSFDIGARKQPVKTVAQIWVDGTKIKVNKNNDLRRIVPNPKTHPDFNLLVLNGSSAAYLRGKDFKFDFAVKRIGFDGVDFNEFVTSFDQINPSESYVLIKAKNKNVLDTLQSIDYNNLAMYGSNIRDGFTNYDLIDEYIALKNKRINDKRRSKSRDLTVEERAEISKVFGHGVDSLLEIDKDGKYHIRGRKIVPNERGVAKVMINGAEYSEDLHAIHLTSDYIGKNKTPQDNTINKNARIIRRDELSKNMLLIMEMFESANISFVLYDDTNARRLGFSNAAHVEGLTFIRYSGFANTSLENAMRDAVEVIVHENMHQIYEYANHDEVREYARSLAELFFSDDSGIELFEYMLKAQDGFRQFAMDFNGFMDYLKRSYKSKLKTRQDFYDLLTYDFSAPTLNIQNIYDEGIYNELLAQITGYLMSDLSVMEKVFNAKVNDSRLLVFNNVFSLVMTKMERDTTKYPKSVQMLMDNVLKKYKDISKTLQNKIISKYGSLIQKKMSPADINKFVKEITDGKYETLGALKTAYFLERVSGKYKDANGYIQKITYVASLSTKILKNGKESFQKLTKEFEEYKNVVELFLTSEDDIFKLSDGKIFGAFKQIRDSSGYKILKDIYDRMVDGTLTDPTEIVELRKTVQKINDNFVTFWDIYADIDPRVLTVLNLPLIEEIEENLDTLVEASRTIYTYMDDYSGMLAAAPSFSWNTDLYTPFNDLRELVYGPLKTLQEQLNPKDSKTKNIFSEIIKLKTAYRASKAEVLASQIEHRVNTAIKNIPRRNDNTAGSMNEFVKELGLLMREIPVIIRENALHGQQAFDAIIDTLEDIAVVFSKTVIAPTPVGSIPNPYAFDENIRIRVQTELVNIYIQFAKFYGFEKQLLAYAAGNVSTFTRVLKDGSVVHLLDNMDKLKPSTKALARSFGAIIRLFETKYTSSLSKTNESKDEYNLRVMKQIENLSKEKKEQLLKLAIKATTALMTPQDFFFAYADAMRGEIDFFQDFYDAYVDADRRRLDVLQEANESYKTFEKNHPNHKKHSVEKVEVSTDILVSMRKDAILTLQAEAQQEMDDRKKEYDDAIDAWKKKKEELKEARKDAKLVGPKKTADPAAYKLTRALVETLKTEVKILKSKKDAQKLIYESMDYEDILRVKIKQWADENKPDQKISRGELYSLAMSLMREVEMQELYENDPTQSIVPTNHLLFGSQISFMDYELMINKGYKEAQSKLVPFIIQAKTRQDVLDYLFDEVFDEIDLENMAFGKERFDALYDVVNEEYTLKFGTALPKQEYYIPFTTAESNIAREFALGTASRTNLGVADGMVAELRIGANNPLRMMNLFGVIENYTQEAANYMYERLITDVQNFMVNTSSGPTFESRLKGTGSIFGTNNKIYEMIENSLINILRYGDVNEGEVVKFIRKGLRNMIGATVGLAVPMMMKQMASIFVIHTKFPELNLMKLIRNIGLSLGKSEFRRWLMATGNNSNFYFRAMVGNVVALADDINPTTTRMINSAFAKATQLLGTHVGWMDSAILVGVFRTAYENEIKLNPSISKDEALERANKTLREVMLFGVANTSTAFRSGLSNNRNILMQMMSRFQSENVMHISALIKDTMMWHGNVAGARERWLRDFVALLLSGFFSALISNASSRMRGYVEDGEGLYDLMVNDFLWENIIGAVPIVNQFTSLARWEKGFILPQAGFQPSVPVISDVFRMIEIISSMENGENIGRKITKLFETLGTVAGVPVRNASRITNTVSRFFSLQGSPVGMRMEQFFTSKTDAQMFADAVKTSNSKQLETLLNRQYTNITTRNEMYKLLIDNPDLKISMRTFDTFRTQNEDGSYTTHTVDPKLEQTYRHASQEALALLTRQGKYKQINDSEKAAAMQRVINYYYNFTKSTTLGETKSKDLLSLNEVVNQALRYAKTDRELEIEKREKARS